MYKIFISLRHWLASLGEIESAPDPLARFTPTELADLPAVHPRQESRVG
jgi:hypothetical protein